MTLQARMADSVQPELIPRLYASVPNGVAAYVDGSYAWDPDKVGPFPYHWRICVTGDPAMAPHARVIDVERFDATPSDVQPYLEARADIGESTIVYCSRSTVPLVMAATRSYPALLWWIATLEDVWYTPAMLVRELDMTYHVQIAENTIRAIQWADMGTYDKSSIWGDPNWSRYPH